jgi:Uma2 family endonuclease
MNKLVRPPNLAPHADAVRPRAWRADELQQMLAAGIISERDRLELIGGEVVAMAAKGARHEILRTELVLFWADRRPSTIKFADETPLLLSDYDEPEPDIILFPSTLRVSDVRGDTVLLVVEIAHSSLSYDLAVKGPLYASFGIREYWVIDARSLATTVHRNPEADGYQDVCVVGPGEVITPLAGAAFAVRIGSLGLEPDN